MSATYKGESVTVLRPATTEDQGFLEGGGDGVLIRMSDGSERIVPKTEIGDSDAPYPEPKPVIRPRKTKTRASRKIVASKHVANSKHKASSSRFYGR